MKNTNTPFKELPISQQEDLSIVLDYLNAKKITLKDVNSRLCDNTMVAMSALKNDPKNIEFLSPRLKNNYGVVSIALEQDGKLLQHTSDIIKNNEMVLYMALKGKDGKLKTNQSEIVKHASPQLQKRILELGVAGFVENIREQEFKKLNTMDKKHDELGSFAASILSAKSISAKIGGLRQKFFQNGQDISNSLKIN